MCPCEQRKLFHVIFFNQTQDEPDKTHAVQTERDKTMVSDQASQEVLNHNNVICKMWKYIFFTYGSVDNYSEVVDQTFPVKEIVWGKQEVPGERTEPRKTVYPVDSITNVDDFFETFYLDH